MPLYNAAAWKLSIYTKKDQGILYLQRGTTYELSLLYFPLLCHENESPLKRQLLYSSIFYNFNTVTKSGA
jgi:hypothetical protein